MQHKHLVPRVGTGDLYCFRGGDAYCRIWTVVEVGDRGGVGGFCSYARVSNSGFLLNSGRPHRAQWGNAILTLGKFCEGSVLVDKVTKMRTRDEYVGDVALGYSGQGDAQGGLGDLLRGLLRGGAGGGQGDKGRGQDQD